jgi:phosphoribosylformylglycinamidine synthase
MDLKEPGNILIVAGMTRLEMGGSLWAEAHGKGGGRVPAVDPEFGCRLFRAVHTAINRGLVRSCHDLSEGGLAVGLAEMALAGGLGADVSLRDVPCEDDAARDVVLLFSESPSRFLLEVAPVCYAALADLMGDLPLGRLGEVVRNGAEPQPGDRGTEPPPTRILPRLSICGLDGRTVIDASVADLKENWQQPLRW